MYVLLNGLAGLYIFARKGNMRNILSVNGCLALLPESAQLNPQQFVYYVASEFEGFLSAVITSCLSLPPLVSHRSMLREFDEWVDY